MSGDNEKTEGVNTAGIKRGLDSNSIQTQMLEMLSCGVLAYTLPERRVLMVNNEAKRLFAFDLDDDQQFYDVMASHIPHTDINTIRNAAAKLKNVGDSHSYNIHSMLSGGRLLTIECSTRLIMLEDGSRVILSTMQDITAQEKMSQLLNSERKQYRVAVTANSLYTYGFDVIDGVVRSDFTYSKDGVTMAEKLGVEFPISFDELERKWTQVIKPEMLTEGTYEPLTCKQLISYYKKGGTSISSEYYNPAFDKHIRKTVLLSKDDVSGHITAVVYAADITESVRAEIRRRREIENVNRTLQKQVEITRSFSSLYFASWEINLETAGVIEITVPDWARPVCEKFGSDARGALMYLAENYIRPETREMMTEFLCFDTIAERLRDQSILTCEYTGMHFNWCEAALIPSKRDADGNVLCVLAAFREINSEKKRRLEAKLALKEAYEAAKRANVSKTAFLSSMSHDIRTPMNAIIGMTTIAQAHIDEKERVSDCLSKIKISGDHLMGLINEVLDMNKIEAGKFSLSSEPFSLSELIDNLVIMTKSQIESKNHTLNIVSRSVVHDNVIGDCRRLQQVFVNFLSNAVKYTPKGGDIRLTVSEKHTDRHDIGSYEIIFEDNGIGMSREFQQIMFEPFSRAMDARVAEIQGTGLGMSIAKNIIDMMNGRIEIESEPNVGTKITVNFFLELQDESDVSIEELRGLKVLVADDDESSRACAGDVLASLDMRCECVGSGEEVIKRISACGKDDGFFAVLLDRKMPGMDGIETAKAVRALDGDIKIIMISVYDWADIEYEARSAGIEGFISKPIFKSRAAYLFKTLLGSTAPPDGQSPLEKFNDADFSGHRVLLVEDNELNSEIAGEIIGAAGLEIDYAKDGREALDIMRGAEAGYYDMILMDIQMPVMNGYQATAAIRALPGEYPKTVPIIAMTANAFAEDVMHAKDAGMNEHIAKPIDLDKLLKMLRKWLKK